MNRLFNPFRYLAGGKALILGIIFIISASLLLYSMGMAQDSYVHIAHTHQSFVSVLLIQVCWWLFPAIIYYVGGLILSKSKIRIIDVLGTTAFAQLLYIPMTAPMMLPAVQQSTALTLQAIQQGMQFNASDMLIIMFYGIWTTLFLILFYVWNYKAFSVSCNVSGAKAIIYFIIVQIAATILGNFIPLTQ